MRLGFHYHLTAINNNGIIITLGSYGRFIESLAQNCDYLICFLHRPLDSEIELMDYSIQSKNVKLVDIGPHTSLPKRLMHSGNVIVNIQKWRNEIDCMLIRCPTPLISCVAQASKPLPISLLIVGDQLAGIDDLQQSPLRKEAIRAWWKWNNKQQLEIAKHSLTIVNSSLLMRQLQEVVPNIVETRTSTLNSEDFYYREDTCQSSQIRLLYTGRMDLAKGLLDMVEALSILVNQGEDVELNFVGWAETGSNIIEKINQVAFENNLADRVIFHGYKSVGPELFAYYKLADIYVLASQSSFEGFPRTIWEAMAHSLPVVATKVGSIPDFISGSAELVDPKDPSKLAAGISRLIHSSKLRQDYIAKGLVLAHQNILDNQVSEMARAIKEWARSQHT